MKTLCWVLSTSVSSTNNSMVSTCEPSWPGICTSRNVSMSSPGEVVPAKRSPLMSSSARSPGAVKGALSLRRGIALRRSSLEPAGIYMR